MAATSPQPSEHTCSHTHTNTQRERQRQRKAEIDRLSKHRIVSTLRTFLELIGISKFIYDIYFLIE